MFIDLNGERTIIEDVTDVAALEYAINECRAELARPVNRDHERHLLDQIDEIEDQIRWLIAAETSELVAA
ncbi:hypothetical protein [Mycobacteroides abscessus]